MPDTKLWTTRKERFGLLIILAAIGVILCVAAYAISPDNKSTISKLQREKIKSFYAANLPLVLPGADAAAQAKNMSLIQQNQNEAERKSENMIGNFVESMKDMNYDFKKVIMKGVVSSLVKESKQLKNDRASAKEVRRYFLVLFDPMSKGGTLKIEGGVNSEVIKLNSEFQHVVLTMTDLDTGFRVTVLDAPNGEVVPAVQTIHGPVLLPVMERNDSLKVEVY
jgi:hypothetical protein